MDVSQSTAKGLYFQITTINDIQKNENTDFAALPVIHITTDMISDEYEDHSFSQVKEDNTPGQVISVGTTHFHKPFATNQAD